MDIFIYCLPLDILDFLMGLKEKVTWLPVENQPQQFHPYAVRTGLPPLDMAALRLSLLEGHERKTIKTPTNGEATLLLSYKKREGAVASVQTADTDLLVTQLQGAHQEGFRISAGLRWLELFADQIQQIALAGPELYERIAMPKPEHIEGIDGAEAGLRKYFAFINLTGLRLSAEEGIYVKDLHI